MLKILSIQLSPLSVLLQVLNVLPAARQVYTYFSRKLLPCQFSAP